MGLLTRFADHQDQKRDKAAMDAHHAKLIADFHAHHDHLDHLARQLHEAGYHVNVDYKSPHVVRHDSHTGVHFYNAGLGVEKKIQISRKVPLRPFDRPKKGDPR